MNCHLSVMCTLLSNGADPNLAKNDGTAPLMIASLNGYGDVVQLLLESKILINSQRKDGANAISFASLKVHLFIVFSLLDNGADNGWTPLVIACAKGYYNIVRDLLKTQVNIDHQTSIGTTALHLSCQYGHENIVRHLLECGANPLVKDMAGHTPLDIAHQYSHHNIVSLLRKAKAGFHDDQESLSGSIESGYITDGLSTDHLLVEDSDIAQISDLDDLPEECRGINTSESRISFLHTNIWLNGKYGITWMVVKSTYILLSQ